MKILRRGCYAWISLINNEVLSSVQTSIQQWPTKYWLLLVRDDLFRKLLRVKIIRCEVKNIGLYSLFAFTLCERIVKFGLLQRYLWSNIKKINTHCPLFSSCCTYELDSKTFPFGKKHINRFICLTPDNIWIHSRSKDKWNYWEAMTFV